MRKKAKSSGLLRSRLPWLLVWLALSLLASCLVATALLLPLVVEEYHQLPRHLSGLVRSQPAPPDAPLSVEQQVRLGADGYPEAFSIYFYSLPTENGLAAVRHEIWHYYRLGKTVTYFNGVQAEEVPLDPLGLAPGTPAYRPEMFSAGFNLSQVIATGGFDELIAVPLEHALLPGGELFFAPRLLFGLHEDGLRYVEVLPFDGSQSAAWRSLQPVSWRPFLSTLALQPQASEVTEFEFGEALLLQLAAYGNLSAGLEVPAPALSAAQRALTPLRIGDLLQRKTTLERINEHNRLSAEFLRLSLKENITEAMRQHWIQKAAYHGEQARRLERHRQRRGWIRRVVREIGNFIGDTITDRMDTLAAQVQFIVEERLPYRVRNVVGLADDLIRKFVDEQWELLDQQLGIIPIDGIRSVVDHWWIRVRDEIRRDLGGRKPPSAGEPPANQPPAQPPASPGAGEEPPEGLQRFNINWYEGACSAGEEFPYKKGVSLVVRPDGSVVGTIRFHDCPGGGSVVYSVSGSPDPNADQVELQGIRVSGSGRLDEESPETSNFTFNVTPEKYGLYLGGP